VASQVDLLGVLFIIWGLLTTLVGVSTLALGVGAVALITSANRTEGGEFGVPLRRRRPWSRIMALVLGSIDLLLLPYGTALGLYGLWVLLHEDAKKLFMDRPASPAA
jgi:hypothetical protein